MKKKKFVVFLTIVLLCTNVPLLAQKMVVSKSKCLPKASARNGMDPVLENRIYDLVKNGDYVKLENYLSLNKPNLNVTFSWGGYETCLLLALHNLERIHRPSNQESFSAHFNVVKVLVKYGADPSAPICRYSIADNVESYRTAILEARFDSEIQSFLIANSSKFDFHPDLISDAIRKEDWGLIEKFAASTTKFDVSKFFCEVVGQKKLSSENKIRCIGIFLLKRGDINAHHWGSLDGGLTYEVQTTPLALACYLNDLQVAKHLLEKGANPNKLWQNKYPGSPLANAVERDNIELVKLLDQYKAEFRFDYLISRAKSEDMKDFLFFKSRKTK